MKNKKTISTVFAMLMLMVCFTASNTFAQTKSDMKMQSGCMMKDGSMMSDGCMMQGGKMMSMKDGKTMPMEHNMIMMNGTTCQTNGECTMKDGKKIMMKEGDCMDMNGKMDKCTMMSKDAKSTSETKKDDKSAAVIWTCPMHPQIQESNPGKCPICGMDLVKKK